MSSNIHAFMKNPDNPDAMMIRLMKKDDMTAVEKLPVPRPNMVTWAC